MSHFFFQLACCRVLFLLSNHFPVHTRRCERSRTRVFLSVFDPGYHQPCFLEKGKIAII